MAWFKVDDKLWGHPKWIATPPRARGLWATAGSWSASNETDGLIPAHVLAVLGGTRADARALVASGLWREEGKDYRFHGWADFQPTRADLDAKRDAERQRKAEWRARKADRHPNVPDVSRWDTAGTDASVPPESRLTRPVPDPTRPDPTPVVGSPDLGGEPKRRASEHPQQACGRQHDPADSCGACGAARRRTKDDELAAQRAKAASERKAARAAQEARAREAEAARAEADANPDQTERAKAAAFAAIRGGSK